LVELNDREFEVRGPTVGQRQAIQNAAMTLDMATQQANIDPVKLQVEAMMELVFVPGTDERVFEEADRDTIFAGDGVGWVDELSNHAVSMITGKSDEGNDDQPTK